MTDEAKHAMGDEQVADTNEHELEFEWVFWYDEKATKGATQQEFEEALRQIGSFKTIQV
jgi:ABC-type Zn2+ transport system substrate-binding protein/surface adhesin